MKHITSIREGHRSLREAQEDMVKLQHMRERRDLLKSTDPLHKDPGLVQFYVNQWPQHASDPKSRQLWSDELDIRIEWQEKYIAEVQAWLKRTEGHAFRDARPKKKQRELGLLPSVENEIAIREGKL